MIDPELFPDEAKQTGAVRLFCFPHAGGGTSQFYRWRRYAGNTVTIVPGRLPGRESRLHQPPGTSLAETAATVAETIASLPAGPFALLGYSFGAHLAYQVASRLPRHGGHAPQAMVVVASKAPGRNPPPTAATQPTPMLSELPDEQLVDQIHRKHGGIPAIVRQDPQWLAAVIPALRADLRMLESQQWEATPPLNCPVLAIGGADDRHVPSESLAGWESVTRGPFQTRQFPGGHFFLYSGFNPAEAIEGGSQAAPVPLATVLKFVQQGAEQTG